MSDKVDQTQETESKQGDIVSRFIKANGAHDVSFHPWGVDSYRKAKVRNNQMRSVGVGSAVLGHCY